MDWNKIHLLMQIIKDAAVVGNCEHIRAKALGELRDLNMAAAPKVFLEPTPEAEPELELKPTRRL